MRTASFAVFFVASAAARAQAPTPATPPSPSAPPAAAEPADTASEPGGPRLFQDARPAMGTRVQIMAFGAEPAAATAAIDAGFAEINRLEEVLSEWRPTSEVSRVNQAAGKGPVTVGPDSLAVVTRGKEIAQETGGAFALTWAALAGLWDFSGGPASKPMVPPEATVAERLRLIDDSKITIDAAASTISLPENVTIGVGAIAEGYALGRAIEVMRARGVSDALVFIGGDIYASGQKGDKPWLVGIQDPRGPGYFATIPVKNEAVCTSGDYEKYFEVDGVRYSHVLDPRTGMPARAARSVTVVGPDPMTADALATAIMVMGPERGMQLIEQKAGYGLVVVDASNQVAVSTSLKDRVRVVRPPTS